MRNSPSFDGVIRGLLATTLAAVLLPRATATAQAAGTVPVGVARIDVTPDHPALLSGYSSRKAEATVVGGRLHVKAIAFGADPSPSVLVTVDNLGVPEAITAEVASRLKAKAGLLRENFAVCASHTHSAPMLLGCAPNIFGKPLDGAEKEHVERYTKTITDAIESAALRALQARKPCILSHGRGSAGFAVNRRLLKDGKWLDFGEVEAGPVDRSVPLLRAEDESGKVVAVMVAYACHCTTLSPDDNAVHGDWAGLSQEMIEAAHPGSVAFTLIGCGADANPRSRPGLEVARKHARELADEAERIMARPLAPVSSAPSGSLRRVPLPFDTIPTRAELEIQARRPDHSGANAKIQLAKLDNLGVIPLALDYPIQVWRFGDDLAMVFLAGEVVVDYSLALKAEFDPGRLWAISYANASPCYIPSDRILSEGGYEADSSMLYYAQPSRLKMGAESIILDAVRGMVPATFKRAVK